MNAPFRPMPFYRPVADECAVFEAAHRLPRALPEIYQTLTTET